MLAINQILDIRQNLAQMSIQTHVAWAFTFRRGMETFIGILAALQMVGSIPEAKNTLLIIQRLERLP